MGAQQNVKHITGILLGLLLTGCGLGLTKEEAAKLTPEQQIFKLANEVNIAFEPAVAYAMQPKCSATVVVACHDPKVVKVLLQLREEATAALKIARAQPDTAAAATLASAVRRILGLLQAELLKTQGVSHGPAGILTFS
jgi:hypothetical protein